MLGLLLLSFSIAANTSAGVRISLRLPVVALVCVTMVQAQLLTGKLLFSGDAVAVTLYISCWISAVLTGALIVQSAGNETLDALVGGWLISALLSVGIALVQLTGAIQLNIYAADLPLGARPFANVAQPNHLCTLCFLGLCGLLYLHQTQRVRAFFFWFAASFLLLGMIVSGSRTGWLQIALLVAGGLALSQRCGLRMRRRQLLMLGAIYALGVLVWPLILDAMLLPASRSMAEQMRPGLRLPFWWSMLDAIGREPLFGYGWQQVGAAQQRVALEQPAMGTLFDHSHNFVLDL
jgi:O-antigen ligase